MYFLDWLLTIVVIGLVLSYYIGNIFWDNRITIEEPLLLKMENLFS